MKIDQLSDHSSLLELLGEQIYSQFSLLYSKLRDCDELNEVFKLDYLSSETLSNEFVVEFLKNEPDFDFNTLATDDDLYWLIDKVNKGYADSNLVLSHVSGSLK